VATHGTSARLPSTIPMVVLDDPHHVRERLWRAVESLATSEKPIQVRVGFAGVELSGLRSDEFVDPAAHVLITAIRERLSSAGGVVDSARAMSDSQAVAVAKLIRARHALLRHQHLVAVIGLRKSESADDFVVRAVDERPSRRFPDLRSLGPT
jgi:hypothetical protein